MGIDLENFNDNVPAEFICPSCRKVVYYPLVTDCFHVLCAKCFNKRAKRRLKCPACGGSMGEGNKKLDSSWRRRYERIKVNCTKGCEMEMTLGELDRHLDEECPLTFAVCSNSGCSKKVRRSDLPEHYKECDYRIVMCENCGFQTRFINVRTHQIVRKCALRKSLHMIVQSRREMDAQVKEHKRQVDEDSFRRTLNERDMEKNKLWTAIYRNNPNRMLSRSPSPSRCVSAMEMVDGNGSPDGYRSSKGGSVTPRSMRSYPDCVSLCMNCKKVFLEDSNHDLACQWHEGVGSYIEYMVLGYSY